MAGTLANKPKRGKDMEVGPRKPANPWDNKK